MQTKKRNKHSLKKILTSVFLLAFCLSTVIFLKTSKNVESFGNPAPITKKVLVLDFDPYVGGGTTPLSVDQGWNDNSVLEPQYISDVNTASGGYVNYQIVSTQVIRDYPYKANNYKFTEQVYLDCLATNGASDPHCDDIIDYQKLINDYNICGQINAGTIHEVWLWGGPWFGYYEAVMAGPNAIDTNGPPITGTSCTKDLHIMGFNYERGNTEMLHDMAHRAEGIMDFVFNDPTASGYSCPGNCPTNRNNVWQRFYIWDKIIPGKSGCGNVHTGPNNNVTYDVFSQTYHQLTNSVQSFCNDFLNYPSTTGNTTSISCSAWNCDGQPTTHDEYEFIKWWLAHLPAKTGMANNVRNNWWKYIVDYTAAIANVNYGEKWYIISTGPNDWNISCTTNTTGATLYFGEDTTCTPDTKYTIKLKFPNVIIPQGSTITSAYLEFIPTGPGGGSQPSLTENINVTNGGFTSANTTWIIASENSSWGGSDKVQSPSLVTIVQSLINHASWDSGDFITVTITDVSGSHTVRQARSYNGEPNAAPRLVITAQAP